eukprot:221033-Chlamydomonas_euryale.AAC.3
MWGGVSLGFGAVSFGCPGKSRGCKLGHGGVSLCGGALSLAHTARTALGVQASCTWRRNRRPRTARSTTLTSRSRAATSHATWCRCFRWWQATGPAMQSGGGQDGCGRLGADAAAVGGLKLGRAGVCGDAPSSQA